MSPEDDFTNQHICQKLGLGSQLKEWYQVATSIPFCHLLINLTPKKLIHLDLALIVAKLQRSFLPARIETKIIDDESTIRL